MPTTPKEKIVKKNLEEQPKQPFESENLPEIFADGVTSFLLGNSISKLTLYSDIGGAKKSVIRLTMPTTAMLRLCKRILSSAKKGEERLIDINVKNEHGLKALLSDVNFAIVNDDIIKE